MSAKKEVKEYKPVSARPLKSFFVSMLTRDISLQDSILDLLDNCVDGILRTKHPKADAERPYAGFYAYISFKANEFVIEDNCGGIPITLAEYAFRMGRPKGRPDDVSGTVGTYGIGMKRAIFKIGKECEISTQNEADAYDVSITREWMAKDDEWDLDVTPSKHKFDKKDGTYILIQSLNPGIAEKFGPDKKDFAADLEKAISTHYAFIISKGFTVRINDIPVKPKPIRLAFSALGKGKHVVRPYMFEGKIKGVDVFLAVGFTRAIPTQSELNDEQEQLRYSSEHAGWTVLCNDRAVLYCDQSEMTGWGEANIPKYHTQFIAISGIVEFKCDDPQLLPTTTTKRGVDASSSVYLQVKNKMREGMKLFIDYTNKWKGQEDESRNHINKVASHYTFTEIKQAAEKLDGFRKTTKLSSDARQYKPDLPMPKAVEGRDRRISFIRSADLVEEVSEFLFDDKKVEPSDVGAKCFDRVLKEARKK